MSTQTHMSDIMQELDELIDGEDYELRDRARLAKKQAKTAKEYGGLEKVIVGYGSKKMLDFSQNRVIIKVEEAVATKEKYGFKKHEAFIQASSAEGVATISRGVNYEDVFIVNRATLAVIAVRSSYYDD